jgi:AcrR family transcriptional regulator
MNSSARRARSAEAKELRVEALLGAARDIAAREGVKNVTLTAVTSHVGLHPSALRRYFSSTEELLLELAEQGWADWRHHLVEGFATARDLDAKVAADFIAASLEGLPIFCDLLTHVALSLEGDVHIERARRYKLAASAAHDAMADTIEEAVRGVDHDGARTVLTVAMASAAYLHQLSRPSPTLRQLYAEVPRWAHSALRFRARLTELLTAVIQGVQVAAGSE